MTGGRGDGEGGDRHRRKGERCLPKGKEKLWVCVGGLGTGKLKCNLWGMCKPAVSPPGVVYPDEAALSSESTCPGYQDGGDSGRLSLKGQ